MEVQLDDSHKSTPLDFQPELDPNLSPLKTPWTPYENHVLPTSFYRARWSVLSLLTLPVPLPRLIRSFKVTGMSIIELLLFFGVLVATALVGYLTWDPEKVTTSGTIAEVVITIGLYFGVRNSILITPLGVSFERVVWWHKLITALGALLGLIHGLGYMASQNWNWALILAGPDEEDDRRRRFVLNLISAVTREGDDDVDYHSKTMTGIIFVALLAAQILLALPPFRKLFYTLFIYYHILIYLAIAIVAIIHGAAALIAGLAFIAIDYGIRYLWQTNVLMRKPVLGKLTKEPGNIVKITMDIQGSGHNSKDAFHYRQGQYMYLYCSKVGWFGWHPLSISSAAYPAKSHTTDVSDTTQQHSSSMITFHVKAVGPWTNKLMSLARSDSDSASNTLPFYIDGPYGEPMIDIESDKYKNIVLIAGGIGITPILSTFATLQDQFQRGRPLNHVKLVWLIRDATVVMAFNDHIQEITDAVKASHAPFHIEIYDTKAGKSDPEALISIGELNDVIQIESGRPNFRQLIDDVVHVAHSQTENDNTKHNEKVAVMACGPVELVKDVAILCERTKNIHFHMEVFQF